MDVRSLIDNFVFVVTKHYFDFEGRTPRGVFWKYVLVYVVIAIILRILRIPLLSTLVTLGLLLPNLGILVRRLHDVDKTGWFVLLPAFPSLVMGFVMMVFPTLGVVLGLAVLGASIYLIVLCMQPGTVGPNRFGPEPRTSL